MGEGHTEEPVLKKVYFIKKPKAGEELTTLLKNLSLIHI